MNVADLRHYNDIKKLVPFEIFRTASAYMSWHNRLTMTDMLEVWEALVVAYAVRIRDIDPLLYAGVKQFLAQTKGRVPFATEDCQLRAQELVAELFPKS